MKAFTESAVDCLNKRGSDRRAAPIGGCFPPSGDGEGWWETVLSTRIGTSPTGRGQLRTPVGPFSWLLSGCVGIYLPEDKAVLKLQAYMSTH